MLSSALFFTFAIHQATALSLPTLPEKNTLVARQGNGAFVIRTDLKQDNDWDRERGGQSCNGKFKYGRSSHDDTLYKRTRSMC